MDIKEVENMKFRKMYPSSILVGAPNFGSYVWVGEHLLNEDEAPIRDKVWLSVEYGEFCPLNCKHCMWKKQVSRAQIPINLLVQKLNELFSSEYKPEFLSISGKEPSVTPKETLMIADTAKKFGIQTIMMTNGIGLTPKFVERAQGVIDMIDLSIDGTKEYHDEIRGKGMFERAIKALDNSLKGDFKHVGIISTATHINYMGIPPLIKMLVDKYHEYVDSGKLRFSIGMYYGLPGDPLILSNSDIISLIHELMQIGVPIRWIFFPNYLSELPEIFSKLDFRMEDIKYCRNTGFGVIKKNNIYFVLLNHMRGNLFVPRISTDGYLFISCTHLLFEENVSKFAIGDITRESIGDIINKFFSNTPYKYSKLFQEPQYCKENCPYYELCRGGDRLMGLYLGDMDALDPYCKRMVKQYA